MTTVGSLRHRIAFQTLTRSNDGQGGFTESWNDFKTVRGDLQPTKASEAYFAQSIRHIGSHTLTIRKLAGVQPDMRVIFRSRIFQIKGIRPQDGLDWFMVVDLQDGVAV